jgi:hypothetical protein
MQGQKYAGQKFYQLFSRYLRHIGLHRNILDYSIIIWKQPTSALFLALATDDCLILVEDRAQFLDLKTKLEAMFEVTLQEGSNFRFLNLHIIQIPVGISIDQTNNIVETIIEPYFKTRDTSKLLAITIPFPTDSSVKQRLYESPILTGSALRINGRNRVAHSSIGMESCYMSQSLLTSTLTMLSCGFLATLMLLSHAVYIFLSPHAHYILVGQ